MNDAIGKSPGSRSAIRKGPFYAANISTANKYSVTQVFMLGGLEVDERTGGVVDASGMAIADAFSGRRAGSAAAERGL